MRTASLGLIAAIVLASPLAHADDPPADPLPLLPPEGPEPPRPELHYEAHPEQAQPVEEPAPNPFAPVTFESNGAPVRVRLDRADGMANAFSCTTPCSMTVPIGAYTLHTEGDGLRTYDAPLEVRSNGFTMTLGAGKKKDYLWGLGLTGASAAAIVAWCAVFVPQIATGANDPYGQTSFTASLVGVGVVAVAGFTVGGILLGKNQKGPLSVRPNLDPKPLTTGFSSPLRFTF